MSATSSRPMRWPRGRQRPTDVVPVAAVGQAAGPVDHLKAHRRRADIGGPAIVFPAGRHAGAGGFLVFIAAAPLRVAGAEGFVVFAAAVGREAAGIQLHGVGAQEGAPVIQRHVHLQHGVVRVEVGNATGAARAPVIVIERDVHVLLSIQIRGVGADAAFQPVVARVIARQISVAVIILRQRRRDAAGHHRLPEILLRPLRLLLSPLQTGGVTVDQRLGLPDGF